ncbi:MAG: hypothetical protein ACI92G_003782 [Candidatus Pelagisphaera sp.]|jgi:hypothetical protein
MAMHVAVNLRMDTKTIFLDSITNLSVDIQLAITSTLIAILVFFLYFGLCMLISRGLKSLEKISILRKSALSHTDGLTLLPHYR